jgi:hypothetical protein
MPYIGGGLEGPRGLGDTNWMDRARQADQAEQLRRIAEISGPQQMRDPTGALQAAIMQQWGTAQQAQLGPQLNALFSGGGGYGDQANQQQAAQMRQALSTAPMAALGNLGIQPGGMRPRPSYSSLADQITGGGY